MKPARVATPLPAALPTALAVAGLLIVGLLIGSGCRRAPPAAEEPERTVTGGEAFHGVLQYRAKDAKLALVRPVFATAEEAPLAAGLSVVGVSVGGVHRAYPLYVLKNHQIVNDRLGGVPIAASW